MKSVNDNDLSFIARHRLFGIFFLKYTTFLRQYSAAIWINIESINIQHYAQYKNLKKKNGVKI